uniref:Uncharacterized protein n=1 Tax=Candidatus Kentrum sp. FW TaxID=2126338 RepID=A0A450SJF3_9GAMM|nr:MAG: hypothetical protein BECKFW1821A_GA0114235_101923 [Candidatus Kentron sp. FW]VFJ53561.1 MAG: hypothetical protein BECKFW1821B_GA0114236_101530 [Candidatus Kentron sp. FW]
MISIAPPSLWIKVFSKSEMSLKEEEKEEPSGGGIFFNLFATSLSRIDRTV